MSLEHCSGTLERVTDQGIVLDGQHLSYSKWFEGPRPDALAIGHVVRVAVDAGKKHRFLKRILAVSGQEDARGVRPAWKPPGIPPQDPKGGFGRILGRASGALPLSAPVSAPAPASASVPASAGARALSADLTRKREQALRITRSAAFDRALTLIEKGIPLEKVVDLASAVETWLLGGEGLPPQTASASDPRGVGDLFSKALQEGFASDWHEFREVLGSFLGHEVVDPYRLSPDEFAQVKGFFGKMVEPHPKESAA